MTNASRIISQVLLLISTPKVGEAATIELQARGINTILLRPNSKVTLKNLRFGLLQPQSIKAAFITPLLEDMKKLY